MPDVFLPQLNQTLHCAQGENLYRVLSAKGLMEGPCGGKGVCGKCKVSIAGKPVLSCLYCVEQNIEVLLPERTSVSDIVSDGFMKAFAHLEQEGYGIAIDIGTTTVVAALYDLSAGKELLSLSCLNGQKTFGQDVISRIHHTIEEPDGLKQLQEAIAEDLRMLTSELLLRGGADPQQVKRVVVAANTTMVHLLAGYPPASLASAPYKPAFEGALSLAPEVLKLPVPCNVDCLPAVASYVGGDITAGMIACGIDENGPLTLFLDIGTNGEIVLSGQKGVYCCSCAAGPALEGMNITCGMRAAAGAIESVSVQDGQIQYRTIRDAAPEGLCGSGLISAIAALRKEEIIRPDGRFANHPLVEKHPQAGKCVMLDRERDIYLSQKDVRQVQLAKGAILSGIYALLNASGHTEADVENVIVAGQFGAHLAAADLVGCGILPNGWEQIVTYAGNTSKSGAAICLLCPDEFTKSESLVCDAHYIELSLLEGYETLFVDCLRF